MVCGVYRCSSCPRGTCGRPGWPAPGLIVQAQGVKGLAVVRFHSRLNLLQADAAHPADGTGEVLVDDILVDADRLKDLAAW